MFMCVYICMYLLSKKVIWGGCQGEKLEEFPPRERQDRSTWKLSHTHKHTTHTVTTLVSIDKLKKNTLKFCTKVGASNYLVMGNQISEVLEQV